jgi:hypothetical protein
MSHDTLGEVSAATALKPDDLREAGIRALRLQFAELHGMNRGKEITVDAFPAVCEDGMGFV